MTPKVSIIIPNYNHVAFLQQRLDSVFNQTFKDFEVILLDDASTDGSPELLKSYQNYPKVSHVVFNELNSGSPFKQWQKGIALAKGEYIWIAESDDYCEHIFLEKMIAGINDYTGIYYSQSIDVDENGKEILHRSYYTSDFEPNIWENNFTMKGEGFIEKYFLVKNVIPNASAVLFKRELVMASIFNEALLKMRMCGDWFFWMQLIKDSTIAFINQDLNYFRNHSQISRNHKNYSTKRQRLDEEAEIRKFALLKWFLFNTLATRRLYMSWFELHTKFDVFKSCFYSVCLPNKNRVIFALNFIHYKLTNK